MRVFGIRLFERKVIGPFDNPLLIRYILFRVPKFGVYVHHLLRSDYDRSLHDHPFAFLSILVKGQYTEHHNQTIDGKEIAALRPRWSVMLRPAEWRHRLELSEPAWSLVFVGPRVRRWGFFLPTGWCHWRRHNPQSNICEEFIVDHSGSD
jgi:hypothetical protein